MHLVSCYIITAYVTHHDHYVIFGTRVMNTAVLDVYGFQKCFGLAASAFENIEFADIHCALKKNFSVSLKGDICFTDVSRTTCALGRNYKHTPDFKRQGLSKDFLRYEMFDFGIFLGGKILAVVFWVACIFKKGFFGFSKLKLLVRGFFWGFVFLAFPPFEHPCHLKSGVPPPPSLSIAFSPD